MTTKKKSKTSKKTKTVAAPAVPVHVAPVKTTAETIWDTIKDQQLDMFALPDQTVTKYCQPITVEPSKLYLTYKASAVIPAMETAFSKVYDIECIDKYIVVSYKNPLPIKK